MARSIYVILGMGVASCIVLALLMQHALKVKQTGDVPPVVHELAQMFGSRFAKPSEFEIVEEPGGRLAEITVYPLMASSRTRIARTVGDYVWRRFDGPAFDALVVTCDDGRGGRQRFLVPRPREVGRRMRELDADEVVLATPRPASSGPAKPSR